MIAKCNECGKDYSTQRFAEAKKRICPVCAKKCSPAILRDLTRSNSQAQTASKKIQQPILWTPKEVMV